MPESFSCPHCGHVVELPQGQTAASGPCIRCGAFMDVAPVTWRGAGPPPLVPQNKSQPPKASWRKRLLVVAIFVVPLGLCGGVIWRSVTQWPTGRVRQQREHMEDCAEQLHRIGQALLAYERAQGSFPPAYVADAQGKPLYSWRVLILPYLGTEAAALYGEFHLDESWNSEANLALLAKMPSCFHCPEDTTASPTDTSYVAVSGAGFIFDGTKTTRLAEITDGPAQTLLLVERSASGIAWSEPRDLLSGDTDFSVDNSPKSVVVSEHENGGFALMADGNPTWIDGFHNDEEMKARCTIAAGD